MTLQNRFGIPSMERSVKTDPSRSPTALFHGGVRFQSARAARRACVQLAKAARRARVQQARAETLAPCTVMLASAGAREAADLGGFLSLPRCSPDDAGHLDEIEARVFSRRKREPSFYPGLF